MKRNCEWRTRKEEEKSDRNWRATTTTDKNIAQLTQSTKNTYVFGWGRINKTLVLFTNKWKCFACCVTSDTEQNSENDIVFALFIRFSYIVICIAILCWNFIAYPFALILPIYSCVFFFYPITIGEWRARKWKISPAQSKFESDLLRNPFTSMRTLAYAMFAFDELLPVPNSLSVCSVACVCLCFFCPAFRLSGVRCTFVSFYVYG